ncbi:GNAT family N-acetyltransferase [Gorillibacterium sp. sgz5001074]|uniref:GNAT family N-acetyltransferase n=1 Tax=Gorillibacterium sp. sgz5001074 TaxID=3446695 RepID=UPI003F6632D2
MSLEIREVPLEEVWRLRLEVMWPGKPLEFVKLPDDTAGLHYGGYIGSELVTVISLFVEGEQAQFRKFATLPEFQGRGYGTALLKHTLEEARRLGARTIKCNARSSKVGFYQRFGMSENGEVFEREGIRYSILEGDLRNGTR